MPFLSMVRSAAVETRSLTQRFSEATQKRRSWRLGWKRRRVLRLECETLLPVVVRLPVTWQTLDTVHLDGVWMSPVARVTAAPARAPGDAAGRSEPRIMQANPFAGKHLGAWVPGTGVGRGNGVRVKFPDQCPGSGAFPRRPTSAPPPPRRCTPAPASPAPAAAPSPATAPRRGTCGRRTWARARPRPRGAGA